MRSMSIGTSAMAASETALATISNNIANSNTTGFKAQNTQFEELFYQQLQSPSAPGSSYAGTNPVDVGNGVRVSTLATDYSNGNVDSTGNKTDMAIQGDGFFVVGDNQGQNTQYTRAGNFQVSKDNQLIDQSGQYVLGWNMDNLTGKINTGAALSPITIPIGTISQPKESTSMLLQGNLNTGSAEGTVYGLQMSSWDRSGGAHPINMNYVKDAGNDFTYVAVPTDQFKPSASISNAVLDISEAVANKLQKGDYSMSTAPSATAGDVDITVKDPSGATVLTKTITDSDQTVTMDDGTNSWFNINYTAGGAPSTAKFTIGEVGNITFNSIGQVASMTGSGPAGTPQITYTPTSTGQPVNINVDMKSLTGLAADSAVSVNNTDGAPAASLTDFTITDGGVIDAYYSDGSIKPISQVALATFSNPGGLSRVGDGNFLTTPNSGIANVGLPNTNSRGQIKAQALEASNVDLSKEFVNMLTAQKSFQANTKVIQTSQDMLTNVIDLIR